MQCYKDKTFCNFYLDCLFGGEDCCRSLTPDVRERANSLGLDVCQFLEKPDCFEER